MRTCVIFNPTARGNKAENFRRHLGEMSRECDFKATAAAGDARRLATEAVAENFELIVAAGGDGTVNEVLNGIADAPGGLERTRFGVLPLGTVNVFARELKIPAQLSAAWEILQRGHELKIDLPRVEFFANGKCERRYFAQLAGVGWDARAIELVSWRLKKKIGTFAYVVAGLKSLCEQKAKITARANNRNYCGELILIGNGKFYGGAFGIFPEANLRDGLLEICVLPRVNFWMLLRSIPNFLWCQKLPENLVQRVRTETVELTAGLSAAFELDGEWVGNLPAKFFVEREKLRVAAP